VSVHKRNLPAVGWRPFQTPPPAVRSTRDRRAAHYDRFRAPAFADATAACVVEAERAAAAALAAGKTRRQALAAAGEVADWWAAPQRDEPDRFTSAADIARAQGICRTRCPLLGECALYAEQAKVAYGVWGGVDRNPTDRKTRRSA
jgi:Transcription factor WhiB